MAVELALPDDLYEVILSAHEGLSEQESHLVNAKLILILTDHVKDTAFLKNAVDIARKSTLDSD